ncbi:MAG: NAD-dependent deacylase [Proteobacteria bacterium]|nr:NAD-dependent deacylase [Pseudomonadota bacterium]
MPAALCSALVAASHVVVFTGAGVSAESGIPTFRDALTGLWENFDAEKLATPAAFRRDPALVWGWYEWRRQAAMQALPNPAHLAIARLAAFVPRLTVITQNVDDLHERAGSTDVIHLHGSFFKPRCFECARPHVFGPGRPNEPEGGRSLEPPRCVRCGERIRPGVVWFGESLPDEEFRLALQAARECDVVFSIGTSALVYPAAGLPVEAARRGAVVVQVNPTATSLDEIATFNLRGAAGAWMDRVVGAAFQS